MTEYLPLIIESGKQFLILGNMNHALYTEIFHYFFEKKTISRAKASPRY